MFCVIAHTCHFGLQQVLQLGLLVQCLCWQLGGSREAQQDDADVVQTALWSEAEVSAEVSNDGRPYKCQHMRHYFILGKAVFEIDHFCTSRSGHQCHTDAAEQENVNGVKKKLWHFEVIEQIHAEALLHNRVIWWPNRAHVAHIYPHTML